MSHPYDLDRRSVNSLNKSFENELKTGDRFAFGENWRQFLSELDEKRIEQAEYALREMLDVERLDGKTFLDIGSGSGIHSLAARRLGAVVQSFDYDTSSVWCTNELRNRYFPNDIGWIVEQGSVLDEEYLSKLGKFDVVYCWGVLHHTGNMWKAMELIAPLINNNGSLFLAIYNDQGILSNLWKAVKLTYCKSPDIVKVLIIYTVFLVMWLPKFLLDFIRLKPFYSWKYYFHSRGMSPWRDLVDWVGGYPFEVSKPEKIIKFFIAHGFSIYNFLSIGNGSGNNQFVFRKE